MVSERDVGQTDNEETSGETDRLSELDTIDTEPSRPVTADAELETEIDRRPGHGSLTRTEAWVESESTTGPNDGRSDTQTTFLERDVESSGPAQLTRTPATKRTWEDLAKVNDGMYSRLTSRASKNRKADHNRWVSTFGDTMRATDFHKTEVKHALEKIDIGPYKGGGIPMELLIVALLSLCIDRDIRPNENEDPAEVMSRRAVERDGTQQLLTDLDTSRQELRDTRNLIRKNDADLLFGENKRR